MSCVEDVCLAYISIQYEKSMGPENSSETREIIYENSREILVLINKDIQQQQIAQMPVAAIISLVSEEFSGPMLFSYWIACALQKLKSSSYIKI